MYSLPETVDISVITNDRTSKSVVADVLIFPTEEILINDRLINALGIVPRESLARDVVLHK